MNRTLAASVVLLSMISLSGCLKPADEVFIGTPDTGSGEIGRQELIRTMPQKGNIRDERRGKEMWFAYGAISGVNEPPANGVVTAHFLEDGTYILDVQVNIAAPEDGMFYEAWLKGSGAEAWISLGHLTSSLHVTRQTGSFESPLDLRNRLAVAVTLEKDGENPLPGGVVAEGVLKVTKR